MKPDYETIHQECSKPLRSKFYVDSNSKPKFNWKYHQPKSFGVYTFGGGSIWLCRDREQKTVSECEREQIRLYNKLKREYEREQKLLNDKKDEVIDSITKEEKLQAVTRKRSIQLLEGLACAPNYKLLYQV